LCHTDKTITHFASSLQANNESNIRNLKLSGHVGFDSLPDQLVNKSVQNGFIFNILCIGEKEKDNFQNLGIDIFLSLVKYV